MARRSKTRVYILEKLRCSGKGAGLAAVIVIRLLFEHIVFDAVERLTVRRWGMQR